jgi:hypothetical protein
MRSQSWGPRPTSARSIATHRVAESESTIRTELSIDDDAERTAQNKQA